MTVSPVLAVKLFRRLINPGNTARSTIMMFTEKRATTRMAAKSVGILSYTLTSRRLNALIKMPQSQTVESYDVSGASGSKHQ